jgi:hypothetical protein
MDDTDHTAPAASPYLTGPDTSPAPALTSTSPDLLGIVVGGLRCASGVSFLVAPAAANRLWGDKEELSITALLLLRSMGYRDALVGGMLLQASVRGAPSTAGWFLASGGADAADLVGGLANHDKMTPSQRQRGLGGAVVGIAIGVLGAARARFRLRKATLAG